MNRLTTPEGECMRKNEWGDTEKCCPDDSCDEGCLNLRIARLADYEDEQERREMISPAVDDIDGWYE